MIISSASPAGSCSIWSARTRSRRRRGSSGPGDIWSESAFWNSSGSAGIAGRLAPKKCNERKENTMSVSESESPAIPSPTPKRTRPRTNKDWWPNQLDLSVLHHHSHLTNPMEEDFNYAEQFKSLDLDALKRDLMAVMTTSQDW